MNDPEEEDTKSSISPFLDNGLVPLRSIKVVASQEAFVEESRSIITNEMENMVLNGLSTLVRLYRINFCVLVTECDKCRTKHCWHPRYKRPIT